MPRKNVRTIFNRIQAPVERQFSADEIIFINQGSSRVLLNSSLYVEPPQEDAFNVRHPHEFRLPYMEGCRDESYFAIKFEGDPPHDLIVIQRQIENL